MTQSPEDLLQVIKTARSCSEEHAFHERLAAKQHRTTRQASPSPSLSARGNIKDEAARVGTRDLSPVASEAAARGSSRNSEVTSAATPSSSAASVATASSTSPHSTTTGLDAASTASAPPDGFCSKSYNEEALSDGAVEAPATRADSAPAHPASPETDIKRSATDPERMTCASSGIMISKLKASMGEVERLEKENSNLKTQLKHTKDDVAAEWKLANHALQEEVESLRTRLDGLSRPSHDER